MKVSDLKEKMVRLESILTAFDSLVVAYSGGVDSSFLLAVARKVIGDKVVAVTAVSPVHPRREKRAAAEFAEGVGVKHIMLPSRELNRPDFVANRGDRCYICKKHVMGEIYKVAAEMGIPHVAHGANMDDLKDYRPGSKAAVEMGVVAPLVDAGFTKDDIRQLSREMRLSTWNKPSLACLASRIPYGTPITRDALEMVEQAEDFMLANGFRTCRVRHHGNIARIEVALEDIPLLLREDIRKNIVGKLREIGFSHIAVDLEGYVQGSMNRDII